MRRKGAYLCTHCALPLQEPRYITSPLFSQFHILRTIVLPNLEGSVSDRQSQASISKLGITIQHIKGRSRLGPTIRKSLWYSRSLT